MSDKTNKETQVFIFCNNIKNLRKKKKLSKTKMAKMLGTSTKSITMIENGILPKRLNCNVLFEIYRNFSIKPQEILSKEIQFDTPNPLSN